MITIRPYRLLYCGVILILALSLNPWWLLGLFIDLETKRS